jgi:hypothetical protein
MKTQVIRPLRKCRHGKASAVLRRADTKIHILVAGRATLITPGQAAYTRQLIPLLQQVRVARPGGPGDPAPGPLR